MKKWNAIQNVARLLLVLLLALMIFVPPMTLKLNKISSNSASYLMELSQEAFSNGKLSEEDYASMTEAIQNANGGADEQNAEAFVFEYITEFETGEKAERFTYSQSLFSAILSVPNAITLVKGDGEYAESGSIQNIEDEANAINENSLQTFMLIQMVKYGIAGSIKSAFSLILALILFAFCTIIMPIKFFVRAVKEIVRMIKGKKNWLNEDNSSNLTSNFSTEAQGVLIHLGIMLLIPLFLRGSTFSPLYIISVLVAVAWLVSVAVPAFADAVPKYEKNRIVRIAASMTIFVGGLIVAVILGAKLLGYDALTETYDDMNMLRLLEWVNPTSVEDAGWGVLFLASLPRILAALCSFIVIDYVIAALVRLVTFSQGFALAKYVRFIFVTLLGILYGTLTVSNGMGNTVILLSILLFALELGYSIYRNKSVNQQMDNVAEALMERLKVLKAEGKLSEEGCANLEETLQELVAVKKLNMKQRMQVNAIEEVIAAIEKEEKAPEAVAEEKT